MEVYYVDDFGGRIPDSWLGQGGSPDDCWHRVEVVKDQPSPCDNCGQPCLGVGTEDKNWGIPQCLQSPEEIGECSTLGKGEHCDRYFPKAEPPWGARHEWRQDNGGQWIFVERLDSDSEIHCPTTGNGVFPSQKSWDAAVSAHEEMLR